MTKKKTQSELTRAEEEIMQHLWDMNGGFVKDIIERMPEPKPAYNTVSTIVRILEQKGFVQHEPVGRSHKYLPSVKRDDYRKFASHRLLDRFFNRSLSGMVHFFADKNELSVSDIEELMQLLEEEKKKRQ